MATERQLERLLKRAQRLNQSDEYWAGTTRLARMWVTPKQAPPYRPYMSLWLSQDGKILGSTAQEHPPTADELFAEFLQTMRRPALGAGRGRRPSRLYLDNAEDVMALTPRLAALGIDCIYRPGLAMADAVMADMEAHIGKHEPLPGLVTISSVTLPQLEHLYQLAAQFYQASPWEGFHDHHPFAIQCPSEDSPRYGIVMGSGGEVFGFAVYDQLADLRSMFTSPVSMRQTGKRSTWLVLFFEEAPAVSFDDLDAMVAHDWLVAAPHAYPVFGRATSDQKFDLPSVSDLLWMEGALGALLTYMDEYMEVVQGVVQPADFILSVPRAEGEADVHFRLLEFEEIFQEDLDE